MTDTAPFTARITTSHGRIYFVTDDLGRTFEAVRKGKKDDAVVGDVVSCSPPVGGKVSILAIQARRNCLFRSNQRRVKTLASNVDVVAVLFAERPTFNPWFVWKALVASKTAGITPILLQTKAELSTPESAASRFAQKLEGIGETILKVRAKTDPKATREALARAFSDKTVLLVGQSGMGKSTLINTLIPEAQVRTREFSEALDIGKQTTTETRLYPVKIENSSFGIIDSPGFQEFGLAHVTPYDLLNAMPDIARYVTGCRYYNCTHTHEPGCSVMTALKEGRIDSERHAFYAALLSEITRSPFASRV